MSLRPIALSRDLLRLRNEGYDLEIRGGYLLVKDVPYVDASHNVCLGILISKLEFAGDIASKPTDHVAYWTGDHPCHADGSRITSIQNGSPPQDFGNGIRADFTFSAKAAYRDYHHKMTTYIGRISGEACKVDPAVSARTYPAIPATGENAGVFNYVDTASSRAGVNSVNGKIAGQRIGIVGLGGTGSYILDFVSKTSVAEIHVFDKDVFSQHNAFRSPGAPSLDELQKKPQKVDRFFEIYSRMHRGIIAHDTFIDAQNAHLLDDLDFVFLCIDVGTSKRAVVAHLTERAIPFIDSGMGVLLIDDSLSGIIRITTSTPETRDAASKHISFSDSDGEANEYASNIQIAELNALNAAMAVVEWKRLFAVYRNARVGTYSGYSIATGDVATEAS